MPVNPAEILEALTTVFTLTGQTHMARRRARSRMVVMRSVLRGAIKRGAPIPVLVPWGEQETRQPAVRHLARLG